MRSFDKPSTTKPNPRKACTTNRSASDAYARAPTLFTPRTPKPVPPRGRPPLRSRDSNQNVPSLSRPATTTRAAFCTRPTIASAQKKANMPVGGGGDNPRPRQPQLSAAVARAGNRPPLTPKVASSRSSTTTTTTQPAVSPLSARRPPNDGGPPFLPNIAPRNGPRQTRLESAGSTPSGTPNPDKGFDGWDVPKVAGLGVSTPRTDGGKSATQTEDKFFHASGARPKSQQENIPQRPASVPQKPATFFYANGSSAEEKRTTSPPSGPLFTPVLASTPEPTSTKFFYANGARDEPSRPGMTTSASTSTVSTSSRIAYQRPSTGSSAPVLGPSAGSRPMSPVKTSATSSVVSSLQGSAIPPGPPIRPSMTSPPSLAPTSNPNGKRRVSIETPARESPPFHRGHARTGSVPILDQLVVPKYARSPQSPETTSPPLSPGLARPAMTMASLLQAAEDLQGEDDSKDAESSVEAPQSPTKSVHSSEPVSELVANARRERKVQDLEITNASLEAINRTLERQLRKQTTELRRYRRLSRSGRLSAPASRIASAMTDPPVDLSDMSEEGRSDDEEQDSLHESDFSSDEADSTDELSADGKMAARRKRDENRLQLDLTKHQELLIDSQRINQSIKRCLDWTDELIKEGNKALEYHVRVSDVELGGHVLTPLDEDEDEHISFQADTLINPPSPTLEPPLQKSAQQVRDSGVELPPSPAD